MTGKVLEVFGHNHCRMVKATLRWLKKNKVEYQYVDVEQDLDANTFVRSCSDGNLSVPVVLFTDGTILVEPTDEQLHEKLFSGES